jgi:hypothetical protein
MARREKPHVSDPAGPGQRRRGCAWIADPWFERCPRPSRTGEPCWCRLVGHGDHEDWPWRVVPPLVPKGHSGASFVYLTEEEVAQGSMRRLRRSSRQEEILQENHLGLESEVPKTPYQDSQL